MFRLASLILRNVLRNRRRTLLTLASMIVSLAILTLMMGIYYGVFLESASTPTSARRIVTRHKVSLTQSLPISYRERIRSLESVEAICSSTWFQGVYRDPKDFFPRFATDVDTLFDVQPEWEISPEQREAFEKTRTGCIAAEAVVKRFGWKLGERITIKGDIYNGINPELTLVGIFKVPDSPSAELLYFSQTYFAELRRAAGDKEADRVGTFGVLLKDEALVPSTCRAIDDMFDNSSAPTRSESEKEFIRSFVAMMGPVRLMLLAMGAAVTFTILLVSANTIAMSVRERTREIAIFRTLGFAPSEIMSIVLAESALLSLIGGTLGLAIGTAMALGIAPFLAWFGFTGMAWQPMAAALLLSLFIGLASSIVPAWFASRQPIVPALRFQG
jgi:putative ABC transport system permease protein